MRPLRVIIPLALIALAIPSSAFGQATRTWVSGVGDDANPCSRTAPCKTFAGAISKTANGGEINCLDPGGFGGVTITKSLTIKCHYTEGGVLVAGTNAIVVNAAATDSVTLRGLDINGTGVGNPVSLSGIKVLSAAKVNIFDNEIYKFQSGVTIAPTSSQTRTVLKNNHIHDNSIGVIQAPGNNTIQFTSAVLRYNDIQQNACGVVDSSQGANASTPVAATSCGTAANTSGISKPTTMTLVHNGINFNGFGVFTRGASATVDIAYNDVTNSDSFGLLRSDGSVVRSTVPATNLVTGNASSDAPNATTNLQKRAPKRHAKHLR